MFYLQYLFLLLSLPPSSSSFSSSSSISSSSPSSSSTSSSRPPLSTPAGSSCNIGQPNPNIPVPDVFQSSGTLLLLIVGDGSAPLLPGVAAPLAIAEVQGIDGREIQRIQLPVTGKTLGKNLACTLATGIYANKTWNWVDNDEHFDADHCNSYDYIGQYPPSQGGPTCGTSGVVKPSLHYNATWNKDPNIPYGKGDGVYPLWYFDREGLMTLSFDGRFVSLPCYVTNPGSAFLKGFWYDGLQVPEWDDKTIAVLDMNGNIDTVTHLPGDNFAYGPLVPSEAQYFTSAIFTGENYPTSPFFVGTAANNGEGTMYIPFDDLAPTKSHNRISNRPGYFDYGKLDFGVRSVTNGEPLIFASYPSMLSAGLEGGGLQHQELRGLSVMTVNGVPGLSTGGGVEFVPLPGFESYSGAPYGFVFETPQSLWLADAGPGATNGPEFCEMLGDGIECPPSYPIGQGWASGDQPPGLWDKYSCTIQHWTTSSEETTEGPWLYDSSIIVASNAPCFSLAGHIINGVFMLYTVTPITSAAPFSLLYSINTITKSVSIIKTAPANVHYRSVVMPPSNRPNYTCPQGQYGAACDLACAYDCCKPCTTSCPEGEILLPYCSTQWDNFCVPQITASPSPSMIPSQSSTHTMTATATATVTASTSQQAISNSIVNDSSSSSSAAVAAGIFGSFFAVIVISSAVTFLFPSSAFSRMVRSSAESTVRRLAAQDNRALITSTSPISTLSNSAAAERLGLLNKNSVKVRT